MGLMYGRVSIDTNYFTEGLVQTAVTPVHQQWWYCIDICCSYAICMLFGSIYYTLHCLNILTQCQMAYIFHMTYSNIFSLMMMYEVCLKFYWSSFLRFKSTVFQHWFRKCLEAGQLTSHYLNQWWPSVLTHVSLSWPQWVNNTHYVFIAKKYGHTKYVASSSF